MKKSILLVLLVAVLGSLFAAQAFAYPVQEGDQVTFSNGLGSTNGGEFYIAKAGTSDFLFRTFCLEINEHVDYSTAFTVSNISDTAYGGGLENGASAGGDGDPISSETKWLYWNFFSGTLDEQTSFEGENFADDRGYWIDALQRAIWLLEDELTSTTDSKANYLVSAATAAVSAGAFLGNVAVMNIEYPNGTYAQSQLIAAPVLEPATVLLLGAGFAGLVFFRRKK